MPAVPVSHWSYIAPVLLLIGSNVFMTAAWYWHLKFKSLPLLTVILLSWSLALVEYCMAVPANRIGFGAGLSLAQLKITQEVITLGVFVPFAVLYMQQPLKLDYLWATLCLVGAVYFIFRA